MLSVIIVNYNVKYFLEQCLCSVYKAGQHISMEVIVVDNHSADGSRDYLEETFRQVQFYWLTENLGFAKACNLGLKHSTGEYILFLNPDTIVSEDCFENCIDFLASHPQSGALGVRMIDESGVFLKESKRAFPSPVTSFFKLTGLARLFPRSARLAKYYLGNLSEGQTHEVDVLAGAFMMIKKSVLDITGGFDEAFFMYGEDIDLSYRIQKKGYINYYYPGVTILHFKGKSTEKNVRYVRMFYRAMRIFVTRHYGGTKAGIYHFGIQCAISASAAISVLIQWLIWSWNIIHKNLYKTRTLVDKGLQLFVVGDAQSYYTVLKLMSGRNKEQVGRIALSADEPNAAGTVDELSDMLKKQNVRRIIFCEGQLSFRQIVQLTEQLPGKSLRIGIHAAKSKGIAGELYMEQ